MTSRILEFPLTPRRLLLTAALLAAAAFIPYLPFLPLPPISDDYLQIGLGREFISASGLSRLAEDALYRTRATSLVLTRLVEAVAGTDIFCHRLVSVFLHLCNGLLIFACGAWPRLGYRRSFVAAMAFLLIASHQEAVIWVAAVHELLVFGFLLLCLLGWVQWLRLRGAGWLAVTAIAFVLALYSKESAAVLPLCLPVSGFARASRRRWISHSSLSPGGDACLPGPSLPPASTICISMTAPSLCMPRFSRTCCVPCGASICLGASPRSPFLPVNASSRLRWRL